jgi:hypothetical protein
MIFLKRETSGMGKIKGLGLAAFLVTVVWVSQVSVAEIPKNHIADTNGISVRSGEKSTSISFERPNGGITQIGIERLDFIPEVYVTMVTASGPTTSDVVLAAATLKTFTNLNEQNSFFDAASITFAYNQSRPGYVISELGRAKLLSSAEARAARIAVERFNLRRIQTAHKNMR